ncbi:MAG: metallophosphoesterase [Myxococcales bacterium FL481]|nr:MAG: metallophosphoesterase [Myxococcales bacterium FL481]
MRSAAMRRGATKASARPQAPRGGRIPASTNGRESNARRCYGNGLVRVWAVSDLHVDYRENAEWVDNLARQDYRGDVLIVGGDVTDDLPRLDATLARLRDAFQAVAFVPGNHELWVRRGSYDCSLEKFEAILACCRVRGVQTEPITLAADGRQVSIVPLHAWYALPEEHPSSLYRDRPGADDIGLGAWADTHFVRWPEAIKGRAWEYFAELNRARLSRRYTGEVVTFSHFLPRLDVGLLGRRSAGAAASERVRFNFSRVAGTDLIERQLRALGAAVHIYGHQHRNVDRTLGGVRYVSNCLGYPSERARGLLAAARLVQVWPPLTRAAEEAGGSSAPAAP